MAKIHCNAFTQQGTSFFQPFEFSIKHRFINLKKPNVNLQNFHDTLLRADYHGAKVKIIHSRVENQVGIEGIVALETKNIFYLGTVFIKLPRFTYFENF